MILTLDQVCNDNQFKDVEHEITAHAEMYTPCVLHLPNYTDRGGAIGDYMKEANYTFELKCDRVTIVGFEAFRMCDNLLKVTMPCVTSVHPKAFNYCSYLETVTMDDVISINSNAFGWCMSLTTVSLPKVTLIDETAFIGCFSITHVVCPFAALEHLLSPADGPVLVRFSSGFRVRVNPHPFDPLTKEERHKLSGAVEGWTGAKRWLAVKTNLNRRERQTALGLLAANRVLSASYLSALPSASLPPLPDLVTNLIHEVADIGLTPYMTIPVTYVYKRN